MTDREKYLTILDRFYRGRGGSLLTKDESEALDYAISSIKTDLKYDLLYEETNHIANVSKMVESTPNDCETCIHNKGVLECDMYACKYEPTTKKCRSCKNFGSHHGICEICKDNKCWTGKEPTTKNDLGVDCISRDEVCRYVAEFVNHEFSTREEEELIDNIITGIERMPSVTPQTRKGHWIPVFQGDEIIDYRCSCCEFGNTFGKGTVGMNYCPRCGSRNEVKQ